MIPSIGKPKISYKDHKTVNFESLDFYLTLAQKIIAKMGSKFAGNFSKTMLHNEDAIAFVANAIMMGDWRWRDNSSDDIRNKSLYSYRNQCGIWAIKTYVTKNYKTKHSKKKKDCQYSLNHLNMDEGLEIGDILADTRQKDPADILADNEDNNNIKELIKNILSSDLLSDKQKEYIRLYFFENLTLEKIGNLHGVTREAIRQSIKNSLQKIRELL